MAAISLPNIDRTYVPTHRKDALNASSDLSSFGTRLRIEETAQKTLQRIQIQPKTEIASRIITSLSLADLSITFVRNVLRLIPSIGPDHAVIRDLGIASASIGIMIGSSVTVGNGIANLHKAQAIGDVEGAKRAASRIASGSVSTTASSLSFAAIFVSASLGGALGIATTLFCGIGSLLNFGITGWAGGLCAQFRSKMNGYLEMKHLSRREQMLKAFEYLKEKIAPTEEEKEGIVREVEARYPDWSPEQKLKMVKKMTLNLSEVKMRFIKRRTDQKTAEKILLEIDCHLEHLQNPKVEKKHLLEAENLIDQVMERNKKKLQLSFVVAVTSAISFAALVLGTFLSWGALPLALYLLSSAIALGILLIPLLLEALVRSTDKVLASQRAMALAPVTVVTTSIDSGLSQ